MVKELNQLIISSSEPGFEEKINNLRNKLSFAGYISSHPEVVKQVTDIVGDVAFRGDEAVAGYTEKFDNVKLSANQLRISKEQLKQAHSQIDSELLKSLRRAIDNVRKYHSAIFIGRLKHPAGIKYTPLKRVGICVPGASAPLPSTVIMTAVPAMVAGVKEIVVVSPPRHNGSIHPVILAVCFELGIRHVYRIGGAQAVAALAWGTESIRKVDKIVGPGNWWVQLAKREVFGLVDIDSVAGPSEVLIIANDSANPAWAAADMLSQAEHSPGSAITITDSPEFADKLLSELKKQLKSLDREQHTAKSLEKFGAIIVVNNINEAIDFANDFASEHLEIHCGSESESIAEKIDNAGAIFIGDYSPVAVGDYWAGPSHTLPTGKSAKFFSALSSNDFIKSTSIIKYDKTKLAESADDIIRLAQTEGLDAHAKSIKIRE